MICIWSSWYHCHPSSLASVKSRTVYLSGPAYPGCPGKKAIKRMCVCVLCSYFFTTDSIVLISINAACWHFISCMKLGNLWHQIHARNFPWQMFDSKFHRHQSMKLQLRYEIMFGYVHCTWLQFHWRQLILSVITNFPSPSRAAFRINPHINLWE